MAMIQFLHLIQPCVKYMSMIYNSFSITIKRIAEQFLIAMHCKVLGNIIFTIISHLSSLHNAKHLSMQAQWIKILDVHKKIH